MYFTEQLLFTIISPSQIRGIAMKHLLLTLSILSPAIFMLAGMFLFLLPSIAIRKLWRVFIGLSFLALVFTLINLFTRWQFPELMPWLAVNQLGLILAVLVQLLCTVIATFSSRYLEGEPGQHRYITALASVMAAVHLLLLANHWVVLIAAWALVGASLQKLLCFYPNRPFVLLAAHKKQMVDRIADVLMISASLIAWNQVGSGSLSELWAYLGQNGMNVGLEICAVCLVLAVILRTALLPVHGWLIQVMEAPTPVSALLHAGVVNLGGFVLIRFAPLLDHSITAPIILLVFGLVTAVLAGLVMLTRVSIKVKLAWSTTAQMGFMVLECALGLYTLAALHLIGHSLYKAHTFLSASMIVRQTKLQEMRGKSTPIAFSLLLAPAFTTTIVLVTQFIFGHSALPWWWNMTLGLAWAPLLWLPSQNSNIQEILKQALSGFIMVTGLLVIASLAHVLSLGINDMPKTSLGVIALIGMASLYICLVILQLRPQALQAWRRWSYAGFYLDEVYTRLALKLWPTHWARGINHTKTLGTL